jgi:CheY-like chemotaxis protein
MELPLVWIIDDDNLFYMITKNNLRKTGIETTTEFFYDGLDSLNALLERVKNNHTLPALIILDLNMPLYDGWSFLQGYMNLTPETRSKMTTERALNTSRETFNSQDILIKDQHRLMKKQDNDLNKINHEMLRWYRKGV